MTSQEHKKAYKKKYRKTKEGLTVDMYSGQKGSSKTAGGYIWKYKQGV